MPKDKTVAFESYRKKLSEKRREQEAEGLRTAQEAQRAQLRALQQGFHSGNVVQDNVDVQRQRLARIQMERQQQERARVLAQERAWNSALEEINFRIATVSSLDVKSGARVAQRNVAEL